MNSPDEPKAQDWAGSGHWIEREHYHFDLHRGKVGKLISAAAESTGWSLCTGLPSPSELRRKGQIETYSKTLVDNTVSEWAIYDWPSFAVVRGKGLEQRRLIVTCMERDGSVTEAPAGVIVLSAESLDNGTTATLYLDERILAAPCRSFEEHLAFTVMEFWAELVRAYERQMAEQTEPASPSSEASQAAPPPTETPPVQSTILSSEAPQNVTAPVPRDAQSSEPPATETAQGVASDEEALLARIADERDRHIARLWRQHHTAGEIGSKTISSKTGSPLKASTVTNIIYRLRRDYGEEVVPRDRDRHSRK